MDTVFTYNTPHLMQWHWPIAVDLFLGGIGAILCPLCVIVGDLFLLAELGHPGRILQTVIGFNVSSPFSWGGPLQAMAQVYDNTTFEELVGEAERMSGEHVPQYSI